MIALQGRPIRANLFSENAPAGLRVVHTHSGVSYTADSSSAPSYFVAWDHDGKKIGTLSTRGFRKVDGQQYLNIGLVDVDKKQRKQYVATNLYTAALKACAMAGYAGLASYLPDVAAKKPIGRIHARLGGFTPEDDEDWRLIPVGKQFQLNEGKPPGVGVDDLPEDMQVLIGDYLDLYGSGSTLGDIDRFPVVDIAVDRFPVTKLDDSRGEVHASVMDVAQMPPVIVCGNIWMDGAHRVWQARKKGLESVRAIDLAKWIKGPFGAPDRLGVIAKPGGKKRSATSVNELAGTLQTADLKVRDYDGEDGNNRHITRIEKGRVPTAWLAGYLGATGEKRGQHRNKTGDAWEQFKADIGKHGIQRAIFVTVDWNKDPEISEGNHRLDAAVELGLKSIPVEIRYFGNSQKQGTVKQRFRA